MGFLSKKGLETMSNSQVKTQPSSYLEDLFNYIVWDPALRLLPVWVAPNLLSLLGTSTLVVSALYVVSFNSAELTEDPPLWVWPAAATALFIFEIFDALDAKQARRTNSTSAIGQFFGYGSSNVGLDTCFNINAVWVLLAKALHFHQSFYTPLLLVLLHLPSFLVSWEEYHCGVLRLTVHNLGATEFLLGVKAVFLLTYFCGYEIWETEVHSELKLSHCVIICIVYV